MNLSFERYQRQMLVSGFGAEGQEKLTNARVLVVGAGGLGSPVLQYLTGAGIGTIGIADADVVSVSNLHRQILHPEENVGINKAESAAMQLKKLNDQVAFHTYPYFITSENIDEILTDYDFVVLCVDNFEARFIINDACVRAGKPFSHGGVVAMNGQVMTYVPGQGPCYRCIFEEVPEPGTVPTSSEVGIIGPAAGVIGNLQALEVIKYFTGMGTLLTGQMLTFDLMTMKSRIVKFPSKNPECKACGK
ncbi:MAG: HesA/MoeB/ThiF family protein [Lachnospiraceae bacterium]|nr:HesA/MoeB/ThiF family protein [Lachnospiraceae bacterium]